ncbi:MAG: 5-(carboxyamino)imidazole ribonucleotide synthase [Planctomycetota bacterium]|jgi:5-(carboxyamino)imidazole ribonucleotide synthase
MTSFRVTSDRNKVVLPGGTIGVFGGGQLGRMFCQAAQRLGYQVVVYTDEAESPAAQVAAQSIVADYRDVDSVKSFAKRIDVATLEFENIPLIAVETAQEFVPIRPGHQVLAVAQNRLKEKSTLRDFGFPVTPFHEVRSYSDVLSAAGLLGWPMVIKTASGGYDGKGQRKVSNATQGNDALELLGPEPLIAEKWIEYVAEVSVLVARNPAGQVEAYPMFTNSHRNHILDLTTVPASGELCHVQAKALEIAKGIAESLVLEGLVCVEMFVDKDGALMVNELAPRPHNSGHLTIEACAVSQFEQQVRAVCNLPLGDASVCRQAAMVNLLGDLWTGDKAPDWTKILARRDAHLHLYGKAQARSGRKMGHLTVLADSALEAARLAIELRGQ